MGLFQAGCVEMLKSYQMPLTSASSAKPAKLIAIASIASKKILCFIVVNVSYKRELYICLWAVPVPRQLRT